MPFETSQYKKNPRIWRIQGDVNDGDLATLTLEIFWRIDWVTPEGKTINSEPGGEIKFSPTPELLLSFSAIAEAIYLQINQPASPPPE
ncbi:hypothetical protein LC593_35960 [Nostoc sp. CHAB 5844]|nr:hypothetical protein [Nostoc sp. CHAB 5844]